jgi:very-short-patch-repair endonuclease
LRSSQLGVAFRRQVPLLGFIADFYAPSVRLVVEVDGGYHVRRVTADARRDRKLARAGYRVLRVEAAQVIRHLPLVIAEIAAACAQP